MIIKRKFKCTGCGKQRPCILEVNLGIQEIAFFDPTEELKCILDKSNKTSFNWKEQTINKLTNKNTKQ